MDRSFLHALPVPPSSPKTADPADRTARDVAGRAGAPAFPRRALAQCVAGMLCGLPLATLAQGLDTEASSGPGLSLRSSNLLQDRIAPSLRPQLPVFVRGDKITGQTDVQTTVEGNAELRRGDTVIRARSLQYTMPDDMAKASGDVHINNAGNVYEGSLLELRVDAFIGFFNDARYHFLLTDAHGEATRVDFLGRDQAVVHQATYTTCQRTDEASWEPAWVLRARSIQLDNEEQVGTADGAVLEFKGVPVLPIPHITFPLSDKRKSGLLPPTIGIDNVSGVEYAQPYYWNIAPNRDATITPTVMSKRGVNLGAEFRYLEPTYSGELTGEFMPNDKLRDRDRWAYGIKHRATVETPIGGLGLNVNVDRVSDDNYWRDFTHRTSPSGVSTQLTQRLLPGDATVSWARDDQSLSLRTLKWQTLQDTSSPIVPPYDRMPQLHYRYAPTELAGGFEASVNADYTSFHADRAYTGQPNAERSYAMAQLSRPFLMPGGFFTPKVQLHTTHYQFDAMLSNGQRSADRTLPTFSLDSGLVFERDAQYFGRSFLQTLEPRAFYTYTPYRDQSMLPVYDTAASDFNFATIYTENAFVGNDRLADNNLLTLGATTRLLDAQTGAEAARFGIAQRVRFSDQDVTLPGGTTANERLSDVLLGAGLNWTPQWAFDSTVQYNPKTGRSLRSTVGARYSPSNYRTVSATYRMQKATGSITEASEQMDIGWQWPLNDLWGDKGQDLGPGRGQGGQRWYTVGRLNYSLKDRKLVDTVVGFEYDSCCWIGRVVLERLQSSVTTSNTRLLFQIEFIGFSRLSLGANPLASLKQNVPRYQYLREQVSTPSRFSNYD